MQLTDAVVALVLVYLCGITHGVAITAYVRRALRPVWMLWDGRDRRHV